MIAKALTRVVLILVLTIALDCIKAANTLATRTFRTVEGSSVDEEKPGVARPVTAEAKEERRAMTTVGSNDSSSRDSGHSGSSGGAALPVADDAVTAAIGSALRAYGSSFSNAQPEDTFAITYSNVTTVPIPPNWVGSTIGDITDTACFRKTHKVNSAGGCTQGYNNTGRTCWAQCPIAYPVACLAECIPMNDDCTLNVLTKVTNAGFVAFNAATIGVFGGIYKTFKTLRKGLLCVLNLFNIAEGITRYLRFRQQYATNGTKEEIYAMLYQTDMFLVDLPVAVAACLGYEVPFAARVADLVVTTVETFIKQLMINRELVMSSARSFLNFLGSTALGNVTQHLDSESVANVTSLIESGSTCGYQLKKLTDRVVAMVNAVREQSPQATNEDIRTFMSHSAIAMHDVPMITNNCLGELLANKTEKAAYQTRDVLRKTFGVIIDQLIDTSTTDMGTAMLKREYNTQVANLGLQVLSAFDPLGIAYLGFHLVQPICGPTEYLGEIDDGTLHEALGLETMDDAFNGTAGTWTKEGDGVVSITFVSSDVEDVTVVIHSGGKKIDKVCVDAGETVKWTSTVQELQDKTLYLDRWRPGFLRLPGKGGGSLKMWIPRASAGGHLEMRVKINVS